MAERRGCRFDNSVGLQRFECNLNIDAKTLNMLRPIKNNQQYEDALARIYALMQRDINTDSKDSGELEMLSIIVKEYENEHYPLPSPQPDLTISLDKAHQNAI